MMSRVRKGVFLCPVSKMYIYKHFFNTGLRDFSNKFNSQYCRRRNNSNIRIQKSHLNIGMKCEYSNIPIFVDIPSIQISCTLGPAGLSQAYTLLEPDN